MVDAKLHDEEGRLAALRRYEVLDTPREASFERVTGLVQAVMNVPIATVSLIDKDRQWYKSCVGMDSSDLPRELSFCTHTIQSREPLAIPDTLADPRFAHYPTVTGEPFIRSYVGVPFASPDGYNLGSLCALDTKPREFAPEQIAVLKSFAALIVDELELRRIAQFDSLTGAATRRSFLLELEKSVAAFQRDGIPASLMVFDLDRFKNINDTHGHPAGDEVLRSVAGCVQERLRKGDTLGRLGGEEFGVLITGDSCDTAEIVANRLRTAIAGLTFPNLPSLQVTASFGISGIEERDRTPQQLIELADTALYAAKRTGRNKCVAVDTLIPANARSESVCA